MRELRRGRVSAFLQEQLAEIIQRELRDPRLGIVTVVAVQPTDDLREARVRVSILGSPAQQRTALRGLEAARPFIQKILATRHTWRHTPVLRFELDESIPKQQALAALLEQARAEDEAAAAQREANQNSRE